MRQGAGTPSNRSRLPANCVGMLPSESAEEDISLEGPNPIPVIVTASPAETGPASGPVPPAGGGPPASGALAGRGPAARAAACRACCARSARRPAVKSAEERSSACLAESGSSPYPRDAVLGGDCSTRGRGVSLGRGWLCASRRKAAFRVARGEDCTAQL